MYPFLNLIFAMVFSYFIGVAIGFLAGHMYGYAKGRQDR